jgi:hypothetical protein
MIDKKEEVDVTDPDAVEGAAPADVADAAKAKGWKESPAKNGKGKVYSSPNGRRGVRVMEGTTGPRAGVDEGIKNGGPYAVVWGIKGGKKTVPLKGNSVLSIRQVLKR